VLVVMDPDYWERILLQHNLDLKVDRSVHNKKIKKILLERITVQIREFPGYAKIRRVALALEPWTVENGMLTPTLKLKRTKVLDHYHAAVNKLYEGH
jgi:long-chain acyl-CoA synthetase